MESKAKKYGDCRCTRRRQRDSKYCGTHLKQIEKIGNLKYGYVSDESDNENKFKDNKNIAESNVYELERSKFEIPHDTHEDDTTYTKIKTNHIKFLNGLEIMLCVDDNTDYDDEINANGDIDVGEIASQYLGMELL